MNTIKVEGCWSPSNARKCLLRTATLTGKSSPGKIVKKTPGKQKEKTLFKFGFVRQQIELLMQLQCNTVNLNTINPLTAQDLGNRFCAKPIGDRNEDVLETGNRDDQPETGIGK